MFTQCPKCETVFRLSAEVLRSAGGQVRCGRCGDVFNALARLAEQPHAFVAGESPLELESRADQILQSPAEEPAPSSAADSEDGFEQIDPDMPPGAEVAHLLPLGEEPDAESASDEFEHSLEFTLPPGDLDRIFIEAGPLGPPAEFVAMVKARTLRALGSADVAPEHFELPPEPREPQPEPQPEPAAHGAHGAHGAQDEYASIDAHDGLQFVQPPPDADIDGDLSSVGSERREANSPAPYTKAATPPAPARISGLEVPEHVRQEMIEEIRRPPEPALGTPRRRAGWVWAWLAAAVVLALLLAAQVIDRYRQTLAARPEFGPALRALYGARGAPLPVPVDLTVYQLRQWGVSGDPAAGDTLKVRASILNTATTFESFPLLRVSLTNRFGSRIGSRDFEPGEYLGRPIARRMAPGERADATLDILDPGRNAEGFEIDVCLRDAARRLTCASDAAGHAP